MREVKKCRVMAFSFLILICFFVLTGCENNQFDNQTSNNNGTSNNQSGNKENSIYNLGQTFVFDGLEMTLDTNYTFETLTNRYSDLNGSSVIKLGVNVKNVSDEKNSLNMFYYDLFGAQGTELKGVSSYFEEEIDGAGDLKPGASYKKYFYILYDGDGLYSIDFDNYSEKLSVEFTIAK